MNNLKLRHRCCICRGTDLREKLSIINFPIYMGVTNKNKDSDLFSNQTWIECQQCGCLQLKQLMPLDLIYQSNHHGDVVGEVWQNHHESFAEFITHGNPSNILEIGAAHGYLANMLIKKLPKATYTIVEPDTRLSNSRIKLIKGFIEDNFSEISGKDCIIHSHVLEHVYDPIEFMRQISLYADKDCEMYISFPDFNGLINGGSLNSLNFEHTYLLNAKHAELIFEYSGFSIIESTTYLSHSLFYRLKKVTHALEGEWNFPNLSSQSQKFLILVKNLKRFVKLANSALENFHGPVYIFGAHVFSQALLVLGLNRTKITGILDNSSEKQNRRLYGSNYQVFSPDVIQNQSEVLIILQASHYQEEIRNQIKLLNSRAIILED